MVAKAYHADCGLSHEIGPCPTVLDPATAERATVITVAQAVSFAIDEVQEFGTSDGAESLFLDLSTTDQDARTALRVTEVSAELENGASFSNFTIKTSDGQEWNVRISAKV